MTGIGVLVPDDGLEDYIRQVGHLPARTYDTGQMERTGQDWQRNRLPEQGPAAGSASEENEELPEDKKKAAEKRLGREHGTWDSE